MTIFVAASYPCYCRRGLIHDFRHKSAFRLTPRFNTTITPEECTRYRAQGAWGDRIITDLLFEAVADMTSDGMHIGGGAASRVLDVLARDVAKWQRVVKNAGIKL